MKYRNALAIGFILMVGVLVGSEISASRWAATATAQGAPVRQNWEYATLTMSGQTFIWDSPGIHASQDQIAKKLGGGKSGITANGTMTSALAIVVTAGQTGWELVAIQGKDEFGITYWLKRPLP